MTRNRVLIALGGLVVSAIFLWLAIRDADAAGVRAALEQAQIGLVLLAVVVLGCGYCFQALRWQKIANSPHPEATVRSEIERYIITPGQATAYKIGMMKFQQLRAEAQAELGDRFDIRAFHDTVLGGGALPLPVLEARVARWVEAVRSSG